MIKKSLIAMAVTSAVLFTGCYATNSNQPATQAPKTTALNVEAIAQASKEANAFF